MLNLANFSKNFHLAQNLPKIGVFWQHRKLKNKNHGVRGETRSFYLFLPFSP